VVTRRGSCRAPNADWLRQRIRSGPFTSRKLTEELAARGIKTDVWVVWTFVHAEELSFKKTIEPAEQDRPNIARKRIHWKAHQGRTEEIWRDLILPGRICSHPLA
jgi:transposase